MANIQKVAQLVSLSDRELLGLRSFGRTSLREIKRKLEDLGLSLGMQMPVGVDGFVDITDATEDLKHDTVEEDYENEIPTAEVEVTEITPDDEMIGFTEGEEE